MTNPADAWAEGYRFARGVDPLVGDNPYREGESNDAPEEWLALDRTSAMMLDRLREEMANVPLLPDEPTAAQVRAYDDWDRRVAAWRLLIGVRLTNLALEGGAECSCGALGSVQHFAPCPMAGDAR